jgi:hypothetical protein
MPVQTNGRILEDVFTCVDLSARDEIAFVGPTQAVAANGEVPNSRPSPLERGPRLIKMPGRVMPD